MYFEIDNTPEHIRRSRRTENDRKVAPQEECPRLILAPFSRPPQVVFDNVLIGTSCERNLEVLNPLKCIQRVTLARSLPHGLQIHLPEDWLELEPDTCYCLTMSWTPTQPTALRETIHFTNEKRGRYDVIVVLKSAMNVKGKNKPKAFRVSPGKKEKKPLKISPVAIQKKKFEAISNTIRRAAQVAQPSQYKKFKLSNKENMPGLHEYTMDSQLSWSQSSFNSVDFHLNTTDMFSNMKKKLMQQTYDKSDMNLTKEAPIPSNVLKASNNQSPGGDVFDNLSFTPLKTLRKSEKLEHGPKIVISMNSDCDDDSLDTKENDGPHSIMYVTSTQPANKWLSTNTIRQNQYLENATVQDKKIPNTSSPKELHSPNFSINTEYSRISDLSFCPPRFSTEMKLFPKVDNDTHDILNDDFDAKMSSDTFTKESPSAQDFPVFFSNQNQTKCRQSLFREYNLRKDHNQYTQRYETNIWREPRGYTKPTSPTRSITPPLQSIPEESQNHYSETQFLDKTDKQMTTFTMDRTFNATRDRSYMAIQTWSKKDVRADPTLWKVPVLQSEKLRKTVRPSISRPSISKPANATFECNKSINKNISLNLIGNVYSQSLTVDPFLSSTYFYDEEAVSKFETEFKRWLNYILTPPADLDCNVDQKIDVGKAWIENRNKEVPLAPTKEQVSSAYHNSHRLESVRRAAKALLLSPEICQVSQKLTAQIDKKLIVVRTDRNLHLDVGLQKAIMELLLCYNPLWLRIGLETLYGLILPVKSNSDIDGMTTFIIQRMFKNPFLKNRHSKASAPNMLLPAYMEAIKKFTLKKFFMLVYFLDQAKQRKLISHDPCLFRRNAICKESREIVIRFTRETIAGIGDITKHLRPLGYVVSHKQTYLDEYLYAVHNIAIDIRDGVRLTKVMEIILMKNGLLNQLRTPAISRLQKIHNVQVALSALKDANFVILGEITATDIADGHREKTMSLLWQLIHVFRAPLFETAANVIQAWWKKKYKVIVEKRMEEERERQKLENAALIIQCWWQRIQYNRLIEKQMHLYTHSTIIIQKYCRRWLCRTRLLKLKTSVLRIEEWYKSVTMIREAKQILQRLRLEREELRKKAAIEIQKNFRRWVCVTKYQKTLKNIVTVQSSVRRYLARKQYLQIRKSVILIQQRYRSKLLMKEGMKKLALQKHYVILIQKQYRMIRQYRIYQKQKSAVKTIEKYYEAIKKMRQERENYLRLKNAVVKVQAMYRGRMVRKEYAKQKSLIINLQRRIRAHQLMKREKSQYINVKNAARIIQKQFKSYLIMKETRRVYLTQRKSVTTIQTHFRAYVLGKAERNSYIKMRSAAISLQRRYKSLLLMRQEKTAFMKLKNSVICVQRNYRAWVEMKKCRISYQKLQAATILIQRKYRALTEMRKERAAYLRLKSAATVFQTRYRAQLAMKSEKNRYKSVLESIICIQRFYRACIERRIQRNQYLKLRQSVIIVQQKYKALLAMRRCRACYLETKSSAICIQRRFRARCLMLEQKTIYRRTLSACVTIQRHFKAYIEGKRQRLTYQTQKAAAVLLQRRYRNIREGRRVRNQYLNLKQVVISVQRRFKANKSAREARRELAAQKIQIWYRSVQTRNICRSEFLRIKQSVTKIQSKFRMYSARKKWLALKNATVIIQRFYKSYRKTKTTRAQYLRIRTCIIKLQALAKRVIVRKRYLEHLQQILRQRREASAICIQSQFRRYIEQSRYLNYRKHVVYIQRLWRGKLLTRQIYAEFVQKRTIITKLQAIIRGYLVRKEVAITRENLVRIREEKRRHWAACKIQAVFRGHMVRAASAMLDARVAALRARWRAGALRSTQDTLEERYDQAMDVLNNFADMESVIIAFKSLELLTEVFPMMYNETAPKVVLRVYSYMSVMNRSVSSVEVLKSAASVLANLTRYRATGPKIYARENIPPLLKYMCRFSTSEVQLFLILSTYLWLFAKYDAVREDLAEYLHTPENHKMMLTIKNNVNRIKRMTQNATKHKPVTWARHSISASSCHSSQILPALEPDYGIARVDQPRYFIDAQQAINCLFRTYKL